MKKVFTFVLFALLSLIGITVAQGQEPDKVVLKSGHKTGFFVTLELNYGAEVDPQALELVDILEEDQKTQIKKVRYKLLKPEVTITGNIKLINATFFKLSGVEIVRAPNLESFFSEPWPQQAGQIDKADFSACPNLQKLALSNAQLKEINVKGCSKLEILALAGNQLKELDLTGCSALYWVQMQSNLFEPDGFDRMIKTLTPKPGGEDNGYLFVIDLHPSAKDQNKCSAKNVRDAKAVNWIVRDATNEGYPGYDYKPNQLSSEEIHIKTRLTIGQGDNYIPLGIEAHELEEFEVEGGEYTTTANGKRYYKISSQSLIIRGKVKSFDCSSAEITYVDVSKNPELETLNIEDNAYLSKVIFGDISKLRHLYAGDIKLGNSIDLSKAENVESLFCQRTGVAMPDLSKLTKLRELNCTGNKWSKLDVSQLPKLEILIAADCGIRSIDLSQNHKLRDVQLQGNYLKALKFTSPSLFHAVIFDNEIKDANMTELMESLPKFRRSHEDGAPEEALIIVVNKDGNPELNKCLDTDVAIAVKKNWKVRAIDSDYQISPYEGIKSKAIEQLGSASLNIYPNPTTDVLKVEGVPAGLSIQLFDTRGVLVRSFISQGDIVTMAVDTLPKGIYMLRIADRTHKVLVK